MSKKPFLYLLTAVLLVGGIYLINYVITESKIAPLSSKAIIPDLLLNNTSVYYHEHAIDRSLSQLDQTIEAINNIEADLDPESKRILDLSIADLREVRKEIVKDSVDSKHLDAAFSKVLNALTLTELRVSEALIETNHGKEAKVALKYAMYHLSNSLKYTTGKKKDYEIHIYNELDSLMENGHLTHDQMIAKLEIMIAELDSLIE
ncbi:MAG: hypothetical protein RIC03_02155 [Cyclobacteriaceae bacterium]